MKRRYDMLVLFSGVERVSEEPDNPGFFVVLEVARPLHWKQHDDHPFRSLLLSAWLPRGWGPKNVALTSSPALSLQNLTTLDHEAVRKY